MSEDEGVRRRIEASIGRGKFLAGLLRVASRDFEQVQGDFIAKLSGIAAGTRELLEQNGMIRQLEYAFSAFWFGMHGQSFTFVDGAVVSIDLPSAASIGIRIGNYIGTVKRSIDRDPVVLQRIVAQLQHVA